MVDMPFEQFCQRMHELSGIDLSSYKPNQLERRLQGLFTRVGASGYRAYVRLLEQDPRRVQEFRDFLTINVSEFFRNPDRYEVLRQHILPQLLSRKPRLSIWSAGCSDGSEPYSLAMAVDDLRKGAARILATDIDETVLETARIGLYAASGERNVPPTLRERYLVEHGDRLSVTPEIRRMVVFRRHDLLQDSFESGFDLIVCRNVVIYFTETAKQILYAKFNQSLAPGGILFVGGTESMFRASSLGFEPMQPSFYRRVG